MSEKRRALGRGLGALIPASPGTDRPIDVFFQDSQGAARRNRESERCRSPTRDKERLRAGRALRRSRRHWRFDRFDRTPRRWPRPCPVPGATFRELPLDAIRPNPRQPRTVFDEDDMGELVHSIREIGVLQPIVVRPCRPTRMPSPASLMNSSWVNGAGAPLERRARKPSQPSSRPPRTTTCSGTPSSRTFTAANSTPWRRQRHTSSCSTTSAAPRRNWPPGSDAPAPRSPTPCACSNSRRRSPDASPPESSRPVTPVRCSLCLMPTQWTGWPTGSSPRVSRCAAPRRSSPSAATRTNLTDGHLAPEPGARNSTTSRGVVGPPRDAGAHLLGQRRGKVTIDFASVEDLHRITDAMGLKKHQD